MRHLSFALTLALGGCSPLIGLAFRVTQPESGEIHLGQEVSGSTRGASDDWTLVCGSPNGGGDRAYVFVPERSGSYRIEVEGSYDCVVAVFDGARESLACNDDSGSTSHSQIELRLEAGRAYTIVVDGYRGRTGSYSMSVEAVSLDPLIELPASDALALGTRSEGDTTGRPDTRTPPCGSTPGSPDQTWRFVPPEAGRYRFRVDAEYDGVLAVYAPDTGAPLACNDDHGSNRASELSVQLVAGQSYEVVIDGYQGATGAYAVTVSQEGDAAGGAIAGTLALNTPIRGDTSQGSPAHAPGCGSATTTLDQTWLFTPPRTGPYQFHLDAEYDSVLAVYERGSSTPIRCNDDFGSTRQSRLMAVLTAGRTYEVVVDGYSTQTGSYMVTVTELTSSGGGAITLDRLASGNSAAGQDRRTPSCGSSAGSPEETWTFAVPRTGMYRIHVDAEYDSVLALYRGALQIACNDDHGGARASRIEYSLNAGETIEIVVDGYHGQQGAYRLRVTAMGGATPTPTPVPVPVLQVENITAMETRCSSAPVLAPGLVAGRIEASAGAARTTCGGGGGGGDTVYRIQVQQRSRLTVRAESLLSPVLELRAACSRGHSVVACSSGTSDPNRAELNGVLEPGRTYFLVVDTQNPADGTFTLDVHIAAAAAAGP